MASACSASAIRNSIIPRASDWRIITISFSSPLWYRKSLSCHSWREGRPSWTRDLFMGSVQVSVSKLSFYYGPVRNWRRDIRFLTHFKFLNRYRMATSLTVDVAGAYQPLAEHGLQHERHGYHFNAKDMPLLLQVLARIALHCNDGGILCCGHLYGFLILKRGPKCYQSPVRFDSGILGAKASQRLITRY